MKKIEKGELGWIGFAVVLIAVLRHRLPTQLEAAYMVTALTLLFLAQSLIRDLWLMYSRKGQAGESKKLRCFCVESVVGFVPIILAAALIGLGIRPQIAVSASIWPLAAAFVMALGFLIKDYVIDLRTLKVRKEKDHINIIFKW